MLRIKTTAWRDMHVHLRQDDLMRRVAPYSAKYCSDVVAMPNTLPAITNAKEAMAYRRACVEALGPNCNPIITIKLTPKTTPKDIVEAAEAGVKAIKCYPADMTTNSDDGLDRETFTKLTGLKPPDSILDCFQTAQDHGMLALFHGEMPGSFCLDAEFDFLPVLRNLSRNFFPFLRIVLEHVTSVAGIEAVRALSREGYPVAGTITTHHMHMTKGLGNVIGRYLRPDNHCLPVPKRPEDVAALRKAATSGETCFFLGSDSAPHPPEKKYCEECCGGCFTSPDPELLVQIFEEEEALDKLQGFVADHATAFYRLEPAFGSLTFSRKPRTVPAIYDGIVPFMAKKTLNWTLE